MIKEEFGIIINGEFIENNESYTHTRKFSTDGKLLVKVSTGEEFEDIVSPYPNDSEYVEKEESMDD